MDFWSSLSDADAMRVLDFEERRLPFGALLDAPLYWSERMGKGALCFGALLGDSAVLARDFLCVEPSAGLRAWTKNVAGYEAAPDFESIFAARGEASFDAAVCPAGSFQREVTVGGSANLLSMLHRALKPHGKLGIDLFMPPLDDLSVSLCLFEPLDLRLPLENAPCNLRCQARFAVIRQGWSEQYRLCAGERERLLLRERRIYFAAELCGLLERSGFKPCGISGDFAGGALTTESRVLCVECERL